MATGSPKPNINPNAKPAAVSSLDMGRDIVDVYTRIGAKAIDLKLQQVPPPDKTINRSYPPTVVDQAGDGFRLSWGYDANFDSYWEVLLALGAITAKGGAGSYVVVNLGNKEHFPTIEIPLYDFAVDVTAFPVRMCGRKSFTVTGINFDALRFTVIVPNFDHSVLSPTDYDIFLPLKLWVMKDSTNLRMRYD